MHIHTINSANYCDKILIHDQWSDHGLDGPSSKNSKIVNNDDDDSIKDLLYATPAKKKNCSNFIWMLGAQNLN